MMSVYYVSQVASFLSHLYLVWLWLDWADGFGHVAPFGLGACLLLRG